MDKQYVKYNNSPISSFAILDFISDQVLTFINPTLLNSASSDYEKNKSRREVIK